MVLIFICCFIAIGLMRAPLEVSNGIRGIPVSGCWILDARYYILSLLNPKSSKSGCWSPLTSRLTPNSDFYPLSSVIGPLTSVL
jgi:hypothetical protein